MMELSGNPIWVAAEHGHVFAPFDETRGVVVTQAIEILGQAPSNPEKAKITIEVNHSAGAYWPALNTYPVSSGEEQQGL